MFIAVIPESRRLPEVNDRITKKATGELVTVAYVNRVDRTVRVLQKGEGDSDDVGALESWDDFELAQYLPVKTEAELRAEYNAPAWKEAHGNPTAEVIEEAVQHALRQQEERAGREVSTRTWASSSRWAPWWGGGRAGPPPRGNLTPDHVVMALVATPR